MLTRIVVAVIFAPILFVLLFFLPPVWTAVLAALIASLGSFELLRASGVARHNRIYVYTALAAGLVPAGFALGHPLWMVTALTLLLMAALFVEAIRRFDGPGPISLEHILVCMFAGIAIPAMLSLLIQLRRMPQGRYLVLLPVISAFLTDSGAYFAGMFFGKHRGVTKVSPNKSLEGYLGGILSGALFMLGYGGILHSLGGLEVSYPIMAVYGLVGSGMTELGDLAFSLIKRQYGVKDYGSLLPGHGGMLDRFDSMIFAAPALWLMVEWFPAF